MMAVPDTAINTFVQANIGNRQAIADAAQQYGVSAADLSRATGYDAGTVSNYFSNAGIDMFGQPATQATTPAPVTPQPPIYQQPTQQTYTSTDETGAPIYEPIYQPPAPPVEYTDPGFAPPTPVTSPQDPNAIQQRIIEEERKRNVEGGLASLGAGLPGQGRTVAQGSTSVIAEEGAAKRQVAGSTPILPGEVH